MNIEDKHELLMQAYSDSSFQDELEEQKNIILKKVEDYARKIEKICSRISNVFSLESRVKGLDSFEEKLYRKNYIQSWEIPENVEGVKSFIKQNLTDLIGLRINCYFTEYEERIYEAFRNFEDPDFELDFTENTIQKNKHKLYKFSGIYKDEYHFEVQIKSVIHNVWGETEHKNVYKNLSYDGYLKEKEVVTSTLFDILRASDNQLYSIFHMEETEMQLIRSLFFCYTSESVATQCKTKVLALHYSHYFNSIENEEELKAFIVNKLSKKEFNPITVELSHKYEELIPIVCEEFPLFYLTCIYHIDSILHKHDSFESFMSYFLEKVLGDVEVDEFDSLQESGFTDEEAESEDMRQMYIAKINIALGDCQIKK